MQIFLRKNDFFLIFVKFELTIQSFHHAIWNFKLIGLIKLFGVQNRTNYLLNYGSQIPQIMARIMFANTTNCTNNYSCSLIQKFLLGSTIINNFSSSSLHPPCILPSSSPRPPLVLPASSQHPPSILPASSLHPPCIP